MKKPLEIQIQKIFNLVPLIFNNQGLTMQELLAKTSFASLQELQSAFDQLMMFGAPPFSPSDFISIYLDNKSRVWLDYPMGLERPLALNSEEWILLQKIIHLELNFVSKANCNTEYLKDLLQKLSGIPLNIENSEQIELHRNIIQEALQDNLQLSFLYRSLSSKEPELRRVDPWYLFRNRGSNYLIAFCQTRRDARFFLVERMQQLEILDNPQEELPPINLKKILNNSFLFQDKDKISGIQITLAFHKGILQHLNETLTLTNIKPYKNKKLGIDNWLLCQCKIQDSIWLRNTLRGYGTEIILLSPKHLRESFYEEFKMIRIPKLL